MKTSEIISTQSKFLSDNSKEYFNILLFPTIFSIASYYIYILIIANVTPFLIFIGILVYIINLILFYRAAVSIHRLVILNEHHDNYGIKVKETLLYGLYSILLFIITLSPLIISIFFPNWTI